MVNANFLDEFSRLFPGLTFPELTDRRADNLLRSNADDLFCRKVRTLDSAGKVDDEHWKIDCIESLAPLHRRLLKRRMETLLLLVKKLSFGDVVDDYQLAV